MDQGQVLLLNLAKGHIGEDSSSLLGGLLVTTIGLAAFSPADTPPAKRRPFFVYVDEFQSFTTLALANMLSELRKYRVGFTLAHQYLHQLEPPCVTPSWEMPARSLLPGWRRGCPLPRARIPVEVRGTRSSAAPQLQHLPEADDRRDAIRTVQRDDANAPNHAPIVHNEVAVRSHSRDAQ
jgi:hypothetical protein